MKRYDADSVLAILAALLAAAIVSVIQMVFVYFPGPLAFVYEATITLVVLMIWVRWQRPAWRAAPACPFASLQCITLACVCCIAVAAAVAFWLPPRPMLRIETVAATTWGRAAILIAGGATAPLFEESIFRGFLLTRLRTRHGPFIALALSAGAFAFAHGDPTRALSQLAAGLILGLMVMRTGRLWLGVLTHGALNWSGMVHEVIGRIQVAERVGRIYPYLCIAIAILAGIQLHHLLTHTRWRLPLRASEAVASPVTWSIDAAG